MELAKQNIEGCEKLTDYLFNKILGMIIENNWPTENIRKQLERDLDLNNLHHLKYTANKCSIKLLCICGITFKSKSKLNEHIKLMVNEIIENIRNAVLTCGLFNANCWNLPYCNNSPCIIANPNSNNLSSINEDALVQLEKELQEPNLISNPDEEMLLQLEIESSIEECIPASPPSDYSVSVNQSFDSFCHCA